MARPWDKDPATGRTQRALVFTVSRPCPTIARSIGSKLNEWLQYREAHTGRDADPSRRHRRRRFRRPICGAAVAAGTSVGHAGGPFGESRLPADALPVRHRDSLPGRHCTGAQGRLRAAAQRGCAPGRGHGLRSRPPARLRTDAHWGGNGPPRSEEHTSELQSLTNLVCRLLLEKKKKKRSTYKKEKKRKHKKNKTETK